ncbi:sperm-associated microtubule inner protein 4 [Entelurus aequoreus]|uniref:sperm-associated microtubule inner protein 4 n=1 Tax=Entelurus aequoreus TaxID=161455 RepID=UPI002B1D60CE|nr:sperm-associated microtubule inner protein 4 [Entelurus aequoreus]
MGPCDINDVTKKSDARLNDQLVPKPTDVNVVEKAIKTGAPREHPYASHISRFAMFPSSRSSGGPGVTVAPFPFVSPIVPTLPRNVTVRSKTKGGPYRHEVLETPTREKTAKLAVLPNPKEVGNVTSSERTNNMVKSLDTMRWVTSYQMHYKGLQMDSKSPKSDDFGEKLSNTTGKTAYFAPLVTERDRTRHVYVPSKVRQVMRRKPERNVKSTSAGVYSNPYSAMYQGSARGQHSARIITGHHDDTTCSHNIDPHPSLHPAAEHSEVSHIKLMVENSCIDYDSKKGGQVQFDKSQTPASTNKQDVKPPKNLPRPRVLPGIAPVRRAAGSQQGASGSLLAVQRSFTRTKAHQNFNNSITYESLDLRDNVFTGKRHNFFGINCNYIHG